VVLVVVGGGFGREGRRVGWVLFGGEKRGFKGWC